MQYWNNSNVRKNLCIWN